MPTRLPSVLDLGTPEAQASYVSDAFLAGDPFLVVLALKEIGATRRVPVALDENPRLGEVMRILADLKLNVTVSVRPGERVGHNDLA